MDETQYERIVLPGERMLEKVSGWHIIWHWEGVGGAINNIRGKAIYGWNQPGLDEAAYMANALYEWLEDPFMSILQERGAGPTAMPGSPRVALNRIAGWRIGWSVWMLEKEGVEIISVKELMCDGETGSKGSDIKKLGDFTQKWMNTSLSRVLLRFKREIHSGWTSEEVDEVEAITR